MQIKEKYASYSILALHGWGFGPATWDLIPFSGQNSTTAHDFGFMGGGSAPLPAPDDYDFILCHSYGGLWALMQGLKPRKGFIFINSFTHFPSLVPPAQLRALRAGVAKNTGKAMERFHKSLGSDLTCDRWDQAALLQALDHLRDLDARVALQALDIPCLVLLGAEDPLCPYALTAAQWAGHIVQMAEDGGHLLPLTHAQWCQEQIEAWINSL